MREGQKNFAQVGLNKSLAGKTIVSKTILKQRQKNDGQKYGDWVLSKNAPGEATSSRKYFSVIHLSVF
jgi:hypothetical protein